MGNWFLPARQRRDWLYRWLIGASVALVTALPVQAQTITIANGDKQTAVVTTTLANPLVAKVKNRGKAQAGVSVTFAVTAGGGTLSQLNALRTAQALRQRLNQPNPGHDRGHEYRHRHSRRHRQRQLHGNGQSGSPQQADRIASQCHHVSYCRRHLSSHHSRSLWEHGDYGH
jgi:hypothetical protein